MLVYRVSPARSLFLPERHGEQIDGLWRSTCFELFAKTPGERAYREFNFSPHCAWAAYEFDDWRAGMVPLHLIHPPNLVDCRLDDRSGIYPSTYEMDVVLPADAIPPAAKIGLSAVIEETDGTKSYWALAHPPGKPDFHHPACFAAELPARPAP